MTRQIINIGTGPDSYTGDNLRTAFTKVNDNFAQLYVGNVGANTSINVLTANTVSTNGNVNAGNVLVQYQVIASGNISAPIFIGNGRYLTGVTVSANTGNIAFSDLTISGSVAGNIVLDPAGDGNVSIVSDVIPGANVTYNLGSSTRQWKDLWLSNSTLYLGGFPVTVSNTGALSVNGSPVTSSYGNANVSVFLPTYSGLLGGTLSTVSQPNITAVGTLTSLTATNDITTTSGRFIGNGSSLTAITGANVNGTVANATYAVTAQFVTGLTGANVTTALGYVPLNSNSANTYSNTNVASYLPTYSGNIAGNISKNGNVWIFGTNGTTTFPTNISVDYSGNNVQFPRIIADTGKAFSVQGQGNIGSAALSWTVDPNAASQYAAVSVSRSGGDNLAKVILQAQSDSGDAATAKTWTFDQTGNLALPASGVLLVSGGITAGPTIASPAPYLSGFGTISSQTMTASGNITGNYILGNGSQLTGLGLTSTTVAIGYGAGATSQGGTTVAIGAFAGMDAQGLSAVAVGFNAGQTTQGTKSVAIGMTSGYSVQGNYAVAIGDSAGYINQGAQAIAIGRFAGLTNQANNSIILNATGANLNATTANTFTVAPVRNDVANVAQVMFYNTTSKEITYGNVISVTGNVTGGNILTAGLISATGNITGNYILGNGSQLTSINAVTVDITDTNGLTTVYYPTFVENRTTAQIARADVDLTYRTDDNLLTVGNVSVTGNISGNIAGFAIGYRDIPQVVFTSNATLALTDAGKHYFSSNSANVITIPNNTTVSFSIGTAISIIQQGTANLTVTPGSGVTMYLAGNSTSSSRTLGNYGMATLMKVDTNTWFINGTGVN